MADTQVAIVTGASTGFGRETAEIFARSGYRVYGTVREAAGRNASNVAGLTAAGVTAVEMDVTEQASVDAAAARILGEAGRVDVLVNNAGNAYFGVAEAFTPEAVERQFATNVFGPLRVNRAFLPSMRERRAGLVVYVSSVVGRLVFPYSGPYTASKWALEALAEAASYELRPLGIDVAIVQPGAFATNINNVMVGPDDAARSEAYGELPKTIQQAMFGALTQSTAGRKASDVAELILSLAHRPAGTRPLRTSIPNDPGVETLNATAAHVQTELMTAMGMGALLPADPVLAS